MITADVHSERPTFSLYINSPECQGTLLDHACAVKEESWDPAGPHAHTWRHKHLVVLRIEGWTISKYGVQLKI